MKSKGITNKALEGKEDRRGWRVATSSTGIVTLSLQLHCESLDIHFMFAHSAYMVQTICKTWFFSGMHEIFQTKGGFVSQRTMVMKTWYFMAESLATLNKRKSNGPGEELVSSLNLGHLPSRWFYIRHQEVCLFLYKMGETISVEVTVAIKLFKVLWNL